MMLGMDVVGVVEGWNMVLGTVVVSSADVVSLSDNGRMLHPATQNRNKKKKRIHAVFFI